METNFRIKTISEQPDLGVFTIEPLSPGFGQTLGNALRRVMLGYVSGAAITSVQIDGVQHQFTSLKGLKEDIVDIVLNLKNVNVSYQGDEPVTLHLKVQGPATVTAGDIEEVTGVTIANPELVITDLADKKAKLDMTITVEKGVGYSPASDHKTDTIGLIPVDAIFSPITRVNYEVSHTRVGRVTNYDKLNLEIHTNGTMTPRDTITKAAEILRDYFELIVNPVEVDEDEEVIIEEAGENNEAYALTVEELELPTRIANALRKAGLGTVKDLAQVPQEDIMKVKNLGGKSITIIQDALRLKGVELSNN